MPPPVEIVVKTMDAETTHTINSKDTGDDLFKRIIEAMGLSQVPLFGLQYEDPKGYLTFLKKDKKILKQELKKEVPLRVSFMAQFYPEAVNEELNHPTIQKLFWMQIREGIVKDEIYCPPELCVLFAGQALQALYGDVSDALHIIPSAELPKRVLDQHAFDDAGWVERIRNSWKYAKGLSKEQAVMEYLNIAQDLEMYGVTYFEVHNKKGTRLWLGVHNLGMDVYEYKNKVTPRLGFPWQEIRNISFNDKKFTIKMVAKDAPDFKFYAPRFKINKRILSLCVGNHKFFVSRRRAQATGMQQTEDRSTVEAKIRKVKESLLQIRMDLDSAKDQSKETAFDRIHKQNESQGMDKFRTMKKAQEGDTKRRVMEFNELDETDA